MSSLNPLAQANRHKAIGDDLFKKSDKVHSPALLPCRTTALEQRKLNASVHPLL